VIPAVHTRDDAARERIRNSLDESLIVEASAGTGKTTELIGRIVRVLMAGTPVDQIVAVTFTHKAAGELKIRLRQELDQARTGCADPHARGHLEDALERLEEAAIGTIHGFCEQILRERPVEARIDPGFEVLTEPEADRVRARAFESWLQHKLRDGSDTLRRTFARLAWRPRWQASTPPIEALQYAGKQLVEWRDYASPWRRPPFDRSARIDALFDECRALAALASQCTRSPDDLAQSLRPLADLLSRPGDYDTREGRLTRLASDLKHDFKKGKGAFAPDITREHVLQARTDLLAHLEAFCQEAGADFAAALRDEMQDFIATYTAHKRRAGKLDFIDLLLIVRDMVRDNREVRNYLQRRCARIFVDEFQDTDPLQAEILILLSADDPAQRDWRGVTPVAGKLFVVGDPKQSIYKFRRADVVLYEDIAQALAARGVATIHLTRSYRAVPAIQQMVNAAFAPLMTGDRQRGEARYAPLEEFTPAYDAQPAVVALPAPVGARATKPEIAERLPHTIAAYIWWLVNRSAWKVRDPRDGARVPLEARHICVLFRKMLDNRRDLSWEYTQALEARNIPHLLVGSKSFYHRDEVETIRTALAAIEWPDDELSVFGTLRGSLFAIPDDLLLRFRLEAHHTLHPFRRLPEDLLAEFTPLREALAILADLNRQRNRRPIADTINALLEKTRAHAGFMLRKAGAQVLANAARIGDLARAFELTGGLSFRGFVEDLAAQAEKAESAEAPVLEEASDGVRLMTVHGAKGLEFPVVILAHVTTNIARQEAERFVDGDLCATRLLEAAPWELLDYERREHAREVAEGVRVAYVAVTRARDLLVVPVVGDRPVDGWLAPLNDAVYPARDDRRAKAAAAGCPVFDGDATVLCAPPEDSVRPGLHRPQAGDHQVVWWDSPALRLDVPPSEGLRQEDILSAEPAAQAAEGIARYRQWQQERLQTIQRGLAPAFRIVSPAEGSDEPPNRRAIHIENVAIAGERPAGPRFGTLMHAILRDLDLRADPRDTSVQIVALARVHARLLGASAEETDAAALAVEAAWAHPLLARARAAQRCHRELPVQLRLADGQLLEGVIDLAFLEHDRWVVVDFKSGVGNSARYESQLQWYLYALSTLTERDAAGYLLRI